MTIQYYSLNTNDNSWTVADFVTQIAGYGGPLGHRVSIDRNGTGVVINFIGKLQSADTILGPWTNVTNTSPYTASATNVAKFCRAAE
jgi:hypothetical protein